MNCPKNVATYSFAGNNTHLHQTGNISVAYIHVCLLKQLAEGNYAIVTTACIVSRVKTGGHGVHVPPTREGRGNCMHLYSTWIDQMESFAL